MQALEGLKVVEVGNILAGPWCGTMMADFGADVIKVEPPKGGDLMRNMGRIKDMWYAVEGRNKRCVTLNLKSEKGKEMLTDLIKDADILIYNGTIEGELTSVDELIAKNSLFADFKAVKSGQVYTTGSNFYQQTSMTCDFIEDLNKVLIGSDDTDYHFLKHIQ